MVRLEVYSAGAESRRQRLWVAALLKNPPAYPLRLSPWPLVEIAPGRSGCGGVDVCGGVEGMLAVVSVDGVADAGGGAVPVGVAAVAAASAAACRPGLAGMCSQGYWPLRNGSGSPAVFTGASVAARDGIAGSSAAAD